MDVREENGRRHALPCGFLLGRTIACLTTLTLGTSMVARQGLIAMAAHQICIQVWLAVSLLTGAMAASGQALIASYLSKGEYKIVKEVVDSVLKIGLFTGISLSVILGVPFGSLATLFTNDPEVLAIVRSGILVRTQIYVWRYISLDSCKCRCLEHRFCICCSLHDGSGCNIFRIFAICSFHFWPSWSLAWFDSLHGLRAVAAMPDICQNQARGGSCTGISRHLS
nr:protein DETOXIFICATION 45, chloroplastic-like isoform X4 [Malus domestica]